MHVSTLLSDLNIKCFSDILGPYRRILPGITVCVDGGAGLGETAEKIFSGLPQSDVHVIAYEPNRENFAAFRYKDHRLKVVEAALSDAEGTAEFLVAQTTQRESATNPYLVRGTSFVGKLTTGNDTARSGDRYSVRVTRLDIDLPKHGVGHVDFLKLDLQGNELPALKGLGHMIADLHWMWLEYGGQPGLLEFLEKHDFVVFDAEYLFFGEQTAQVRDLFHVTRQGGTNSVGKSIFFGRRKHVWQDFERGFKFCRTKRGMVQTDIVAVSKRHLATFLDACHGLARPEDKFDRVRMPDDRL